MFKVGDKVRCIKELYYNWINTGEIFEVTEVFPVGIKLKKISIGTIGNTVYPNECFELVKEKKKAEVLNKKEIYLNVGTVDNTITPIKAIVNGIATILFYYSSFDYMPIERKIVTKCQEGDKFSKEDGLRICVLKAMKREIERELKQY